MAIFNLFSKRQKALRGDIPEIYQYDNIPQALRVQVIHITEGAIGQSQYSATSDHIYESIKQTLCNEYGRFTLTDAYDSDKQQVLNFILRTQDTEEVIDAIELIFKHILNTVKPDYFHYRNNSTSTINPDEAISDLNARFKEHGVGYSFDGGEIIRIDSTLIHNEITKPAISLLWNAMFQGASEEYMKAHEHYRNGRNEECLTDCLKAFESTLKIICTEKKWAFNPTDAAKKLIQVCFQNGLVPVFTQNQFTSLQNLIESGIPTIRNKLGGHGQGQVPRIVSDSMTRYGLNLTGANIIFLIEQSGL